jgi:glutathionyl-hydroquinone reductase
VPPHPDFHSSLPFKLGICPNKLGIHQLLNNEISDIILKTNSSVDTLVTLKNNFYGKNISKRIKRNTSNCVK